MSLLKRCPHFRGCCVQASMELGPEDMSLLERCPHFRRVLYYVHASKMHIAMVQTHIPKSFQFFDVQSKYPKM